MPTDNTREEYVRKLNSIKQDRTINYGYKAWSEVHNRPNPYNPISNPSHYTEGREYEPRKVIADWGLGYNLGNALKYISRAGRKGDTLSDLKKARQYIDFEIELYE